MKKYEQSFLTELKKWLCHNWRETCFIEAKISVGDKPLNLKSGFKDHQLPTLSLIRNGSFGYKISDMDRLCKPFDLIFAHHAKSWIAIHWIRPRNKTFYLINPFAIQGCIDDGKKSLTEQDAINLADHILTLR